MPRPCSDAFGRSPRACVVFYEVALYVVMRPPLTLQRFILHSCAPSLRLLLCTCLRLIQNRSIDRCGILQRLVRWRYLGTDPGERGGRQEDAAPSGQGYGKVAGASGFQAFESSEQSHQRVLQRVTITCASTWELALTTLFHCSFSVVPTRKTFSSGDALSD